MYEHCRNSIPNNHVNAFLDLNDIPYLLGEYLDRNNFTQIDKSLIRNEIIINQNDQMRTIVDININNAQSTTGNSDKEKDLLRMIGIHYHHLSHRFDVSKQGIIARIDYQLENQRTNQIIRSASEDMRISNRNYFVNINPSDINDNTIITNFSDSISSIVDQFNHGSDKMAARITKVQMFYECVINKHQMSHEDYHTDEYDNRFRGSHEYDDHNFNMMFNRLYHFDNKRNDIVLHFEEIEDINNHIILIPCGIVSTNKSFIVNPGHKIIFKMSIWKNDLTVVNDTRKIANVIKDHCHNNYPDDSLAMTNDEIAKALELLN